MSIQRTDSTDYVTGLWVVGNDSLGVKGSLIPTTGSDGASIFVDDLNSPTTDDIEFRAFITTLPSTGDLYLYENGSFIFEPSGSDSESFIVDIYKDGVFDRSETVEIFTNVEEPVATSTINITATSIPDGSYVTHFYNQATEEALPKQTLTYTSGEATATLAVSDSTRVWAFITPTSLALKSTTGFADTGDTE